MKIHGITLLGLGPGDPKKLTRECWKIIENASEIYLRTIHHGAVVDFPESIAVHSFDHLYEIYDSFDEVYTEIVDQILALGRRPGGVIYAVPGHPFVAESTSLEIYRRAMGAEIPVQVCDGLSFLEPVFSSLGIDPFPSTALVDALALMSGHHPLFPPDSPALIAQIYDVYIAAEVKLTLMNLYPDEHPVKLVHAAGTEKIMIEELPLYGIDRSHHIGLSTVLYLPPLGESTSFEVLQEIAAHLRAPEGCPWDQVQTLQSMRPHLMEEAYEVLAAIDSENPIGIKEELGDLLLVVTMLMQICAEEGDFNSADVINGISTKLIHRHPHVFGELQVDGEKAVLENWEKLKAKERAANGEGEKGLLEGVSIALPALTQAQEYQSRAARVGFDWQAVDGVIEKVAEEVTEIQNAPDEASRASELGDLFFALVNLSRWYEVDTESALRAANIRFKERFSHIEGAARAQGRDIREMSLDEMDALWDEAKRGDG
jgi:tetrapyrrole methylase family protein/MazG family protein